MGLRPERLVPLRLDSSGQIVTVTHEDGAAYQYALTVSGGFHGSGNNYNSLVQNYDGSWDEAVRESGLRYHFPAGGYVSCSYRETPQGRRLTYKL